MAETFSERIKRLESLGTLAVGDRVRVIVSGRTGILVARRRPARDGWNVRWDKPEFGVTEGRVATVNLEPAGDCAPGRCRLVGVSMDQHRPDCPLRAFERDDSFGGDYDDSEGES